MSHVALQVGGLKVGPTFYIGIRSPCMRIRIKRIRNNLVASAIIGTTSLVTLQSPSKYPFSLHLGLEINHNLRLSAGNVQLLSESPDGPSPYCGSWADQGCPYSNLEVK